MQKSAEVEIPVLVQRGFECKSVSVNGIAAVAQEHPSFSGDMDSWIERWRVSLADTNVSLDIRIHIQRAISIS